MEAKEREIGSGAFNRELPSKSDVWAQIALTALLLTGFGRLLLTPGFLGVSKPSTFSAQPHEVRESK